MEQIELTNYETTLGAVIGSGAPWTRLRGRLANQKCTFTCCGTLPAMPWRRRAWIPAGCNTSWAMPASPTRFVTPQCPRTVQGRMAPLEHATIAHRTPLMRQSTLDGHTRRSVPARTDARRRGSSLRLKVSGSSSTNG
jgi:hypothetical protein